MTTHVECKEEPPVRTSGFKSLRALTKHLRWVILKVKLTTPFTPRSFSSTSLFDSCGEKEEAIDWMVLLQDFFMCFTLW